MPNFMSDFQIKVWDPTRDLKNLSISTSTSGVGLPASRVPLVHNITEHWLHNVFRV